jgi:hypothetical protein
MDTIGFLPKTHRSFIGLISEIVGTIELMCYLPSASSFSCSRILIRDGSTAEPIFSVVGWDGRISISCNVDGFD